MATIVTRSGKGSPLTNNEVDANFVNLNTELGTKADTSSLATVATTGAYADLTGKPTIGSADGSIAVTGTTNIDLSVAVAGSTSNVVLPVRNTTGATLTKGTAVYISGATGQLSTVSKAIATSDATSAQTLGLVTANIANNSNGNVTLIGTITNIDTSAYTDGQQLYLSPTTAGTLTATKPHAPSHMVYVAVVEHAHPSQGKLFVKVQNGYEMDELHDVAAQTPSNNDGLFYNTSTSLWESKSIVTALGYTPYNASNPDGYITSSALTPYAQLSGAAFTGNVTTTGSLGLGTTSAGYRFDVASADTTAGLGYAMRLRSNATATAAAFQFTNSAASVENGLIACTDAGIITVQGSSAAAFRTNGNERMRIDSSGNFGIGTSFPISKFQVNGTAAAGAITAFVTNTDATGFTSVAFGNGTDTKGQIWVGNASYASFGGAGSMNYSANSGPHVWYTNYTENMRLSGGNLGVGVTPTTGGYGRGIQISGDPASDLGTLWIQPINTNDHRVSLTNNAKNSGVGTWAYNASSQSATMYEQVSGIHRWYTAGTGTANATISFSESMRIDSSGNVGIGTSGATFRLVAANNSFDGVGMGSSSTYSFVTLGGYFSSTAGAAQIGYERSTGAFVFGNGTRDVPTERMRIGANGGVAIGGTGTDATLHIQSAAGGFNRLTQMSPSGTSKDAFNIMAAKNSGGTDLWWSWGVDTSNRWRINQGVGFANNGIIMDDVGQITSADVAAAFGYKGLPQNQRTGAYTLALSDIGKHLYVTAGAFAVTIPADATLNFPVGAAITFVCEDAAKTIVPASGVVLVLAGTGAATTGTRTLAIGSVATLIKVQANRWYISGSGVT